MSVTTLARSSRPAPRPDAGRAGLDGRVAALARSLPPPGLPGAEPRPAGKISDCLRAGRNLGDLERLAADIRARGLRHPLTITADGRLIVGARRLAACCLAGAGPVPCRTVTEIREALAVIAWENADDLASGDARLRVPATIAALAGQSVAIRELAWWTRRSPVLDGALTDHRHELAGACDGPGETGFLNGNQYSMIHRIALAATGWEAPSTGKGNPRRLSPADQAQAREILASLDHRDASRIIPAGRRWRAASPLSAQAAARTRTTTPRGQAAGRTRTTTPRGLPPLTSDGAAAFLRTITGIDHAVAATAIPGPAVEDDQVALIDGALGDLIRTMRAYRSRLRKSRYTTTTTSERTP